MPTHCSLTKTGKVRNQTPQIGSITRKKRGPQRRNRWSYQKLLAEERYYDSRNRRRRRRR